MWRDGEISSVDQSMSGPAVGGRIRHGGNSLADDVSEPRVSVPKSNGHRGSKLATTGLLLLSLAFGACRTQPEPPPDRQDRDLDGIIDRLDSCPARAENFNGNRDDDGCPDEDTRKVVLRGGEIVLTEPLKFTPGKPLLAPESIPLAMEILKILQDQSTLKVRIEGHTDNKGNAQANARLSQARAQAVMDFLVQKGIEADRLVAEGKGATAPKAANDTPEGRAINRRVEFHVIEGG